MNNYLPSKRFLIFIAIIAGGALIFLVGSYLVNKKQEFAQKSSPITADKSLLENLFDKDSDGDGLKDWEEVLWGTDQEKAATFDEILDLAWVESRQKEIAGSNGITASDENGEENQTDKFSRELYATLAALEAENVDQTTIYDISANLGTAMFDSELPDYFKQVKIGSISEEMYLENLVNSIEKAGDLGNELAVIGAVTAGEESPEKIVGFAGSYKDLANELSNLIVPEGLSAFHLSLINDLYKVGLSLDSLAKTTSDPIVGLIGLAQYQKYTERIEENMDNIVI